MFADIELFALGAAVVIDSTLLLTLLEHNNRQRLIVPLVGLIFGAWLFHSAALAQALLKDSSLPLSQSLNEFMLSASVIGLMLMPSAMLHGAMRALMTGVDYSLARDWRYCAFYLPLVFLMPLVGAIHSHDYATFGDIASRWELPFILWVLLVNVVSGLTFLWLRANASPVWAGEFVSAAGWGLLLIALAQGILSFSRPHAAPGLLPYWTLSLQLTPMPLIILVAYFIIRYNFLQLVLERVFIYASLIAAAALFHHIFLQDLWQSLSAHYRINFALLEGVAIAALILLIRPLRERSAEALRYLMGQRIDISRRNTRNFILAMSSQATHQPEQIVNWFVVSGANALGVEGLAVWLFDAESAVALQCAKPPLAIDDEQARHLHQMMQAHGITVCRPHSAPTVRCGDHLLMAGASAAVFIEHPRIDGLVIAGRGNGEMHQERLNNLTIIVEQLALTLATSQAYAEHRLIERRALQNDKLAALGLVASSIAHEVKNPLSAIKTIATVMQEELAAGDSHQQDLALISSEATRLSSTIDRLLQFARPGHTSDTTTDLPGAVEIVFQVMRHIARQQAIELISELDSQLPTLDTDPVVVREILFNLIANAIEACHSGGRVIVRASANQDYLTFSVSDNGPGIPSEVLSSLYTPFTTSKKDGTGLGLYLVKLRVAEAGGNIDCVSTTSGSTFSVHLSLNNEL